MNKDVVSTYYLLRIMFYAKDQIVIKAHIIPTFIEFSVMGKVECEIKLTQYKYNMVIKEVGPMKENN